jgi:hypothetical protein
LVLGDAAFSNSEIIDVTETTRLLGFGTMDLVIDDS